jgi:hypothetical protein
MARYRARQENLQSLARPVFQRHIHVMSKPSENLPKDKVSGDGGDAAVPKPTTEEPREIGGPKGPEPTRYGDWEVGGRCSDF